MAYSTTFINSKADMDWLFDTHLKHRKDRTQWKAALLVGNEDCPKEVTLYAKKMPLVTDCVRKAIENYQPCDNIIFAV